MTKKKTGRLATVTPKRQTVQKNQDTISKQPLISIIIPALNEEKYIEQLLKSIKKQTYTNYEIIVADAGSKDRTVEIAKKYGAKVVKGGIPSVGRNAGAKVAKGEILLFLDADAIVKPNCLENIVKYFKQGHVDLIALSSKSILYDFEKQQLSLWRRFVNIIGSSGANLLSYAMRVSNKPLLGTGLMAVKRSVFEQVGGFRTDLVYAEDNHFIQNVMKVTGNVMVYPFPIVVSSRRFKKFRTLVGMVLLGPLIIVVLTTGKIFNMYDFATKITTHLMSFFYGQMGGDN